MTAGGILWPFAVNAAVRLLIKIHFWNSQKPNLFEAVFAELFGCVQKWIFIIAGREFFGTFCRRKKYYTNPWSSIASATFLNPAMFAPAM